MEKNDIVWAGTSVFPDGRPVPDVLTPQEAAVFLRIDGAAHWENTLRYYRDKGDLSATRIGKKMFYTRRALTDFLDKVTK